MSTDYGWEVLRQLCDTAWCAPCTWAPLRWLSLLGAL